MSLPFNNYAKYHFRAKGLLYSLLFVIIMLSSFEVCEAQPSKMTQQKQGKGLIKKKRGIKEEKSLFNFGEPKYLRKAKRDDDKRDKRQKKEFEKYVKENRERSIEIQTPEVQERMKQNVKDANNRYDTKSKNVSSRGKAAKKKYK